MINNYECFKEEYELEASNKKKEMKFKVIRNEQETSIEDMKRYKATLTTLVRIKGSEDYNVVPVKSTEPIDLDMHIECSKALSRLYVGVPIRIGDIVCKNLLNTGVDIICTRNIIN